MTDLDTQRVIGEYYLGVALFFEMHIMIRSTQPTPLTVYSWYNVGQCMSTNQMILH